MARIWIPKITALAAHARSIAAYGGGGVRDEGLLESALAPPNNLIASGAPDDFDLAAAYAFGIVRNLFFGDGNKRTAFLTCALFLELNGHHFAAPEPDTTATMLAFASGEISEGEFATSLNANCTPA